MKNIFLIICIVLIGLTIEGCCKLKIEQKELQLYFTSNYSSTDSVKLIYSQAYDDRNYSETFLILKNNPIIITETTHSYFRSNMDSLIVVINSKNVKDTLSKFVHSSYTKKSGCPGERVELFSFERNKKVFGAANQIRIDY